MSDFSYQGKELDLFSKAVSWKRYWGERLQPFVSGRVLEVGAGQGNNLDVLLNETCQEWICLEPDPMLLDRAGGHPTAVDPRVRLVLGETRNLLEEGDAGLFDCILYIDVLEHIEEDREELARAARLLVSGGRLIVLSPAFSFLFSAFDHAVGHQRRYDRSSLGRLANEQLDQVEVGYLDSLGFFLSAANRLLLKQQLPTCGQIAFWDRCVIPGSRLLDPLLGRWWGRSIMMVWRKREAAP